MQDTVKRMQRQVTEWEKIFEKSHIWSIWLRRSKVNSLHMHALAQEDRFLSGKRLFTFCYIQEHRKTSTMCAVTNPWIQTTHLQQLATICEFCFIYCLRHPEISLINSSVYISHWKGRFTSLINHCAMIAPSKSHSKLVASKKIN